MTPKSPFEIDWPLINTTLFFQAHCIVKICEDNASKHGADLLKPLNDLLNSCDNISVIQMALKGKAISVVEF